MVDDDKIRLQTSHSSFYLSDVTSFTYGPFVSRFWMLRKHMILLGKHELERDAPFFAWNCITISFADKNDVYLIIKNEKVLADFIKLLISKTDTINGRRGTAIKLRKMQVESMRKRNHKKLDTLQEALVSEQIETRIFR